MGLFGKWKPDLDNIATKLGAAAAYGRGDSGEATDILEAQYKRRALKQKEEEEARREQAMREAAKRLGISDDQFALYQGGMGEALPKQPGPNDTERDYEYILKTLGPEAAKQFLQNKADPPQYRQGPDGQFYRISPATQPQAGSMPKGYDPEEWEVVPDQRGGGGGNATGGFPPRYRR